MSLTESIVGDAPLEWFRVRPATARHIGELGYAVGHGPQLALGEPASRDGGRDSFSKLVLVGRLREAIRRLNPAILEEARATIRQFRRVRIERRTDP